MNGFQWLGYGATPPQVGNNLDFLMRLTDPIIQMQGMAQYLGWLNEAMRQDRAIAAQLEKERNEQIRQQKLIEENMLRTQAAMQAEAQKIRAERTANLMQGIGNVAMFFSEFLKDHPNIFKIRRRSNPRTNNPSNNPTLGGS